MMEKNAPFAPAPKKLVPEIEFKNKAIYNAFTNPVPVEIYQGTTIGLQMHGWPTICRGDGDTVYAAASLRMGHVDPFGATVFYVSEDGGNTWSAPRVINDTPFDDRDTGIVYMGNGKLLITFFTIGVPQFLPGGSYYDLMWWFANDEQNLAKLKQWVKMPQDQIRSGESYWYILSDDYGQTWSAPIKAPVTAPHGPTIANDGSLIFLGGASGNLELHRSVDSGRTWKYQATVPTPQMENKEGTRYNFNEAYIVQLRDGSYLAGTRFEDINNSSDTLQVYISHSKDGVNFTEAEPIEGQVGAPPHFLELSNGAIVLTYSYRGGREGDKNYGCRARVSYDGGYTWDEEIILSECPFLDLGYPSTVELSDGTLLTAYYQAENEGEGGSLLYTKWRLNEPKN